MLCMVQVAKGAKDSLTEVIRSGDLIAYTAEEGVRYLGEVPSCPLMGRAHAMTLLLPLLAGTPVATDIDN